MFINETERLCARERKREIERERERKKEEKHAVSIRMLNNGMIVYVYI